MPPKMLFLGIGIKKFFSILRRLHDFKIGQPSMVASRQRQLAYLFVITKMSDMLPPIGHQICKQTIR